MLDKKIYILGRVEKAPCIRIQRKSKLSLWKNFFKEIILPKCNVIAAKEQWQSHYIKRIPASNCNGSMENRNLVNVEQMVLPIRGTGTERFWSSRQRGHRVKHTEPPPNAKPFSKNRDPSRHVSASILGGPRACGANESHGEPAPKFKRATRDQWFCVFPPKSCHGKM